MLPLFFDTTSQYAVNCEVLYPSEKPFEFDNSSTLRKLIEKQINLKTRLKSNKVKNVKFVDYNIIIKNIDYYYTNPIARASKVMNDCKKISKNLNFIGVEKAS